MGKLGKFPERRVDKASPRPFLQFTGGGGFLVHPPSFVWRAYTPEEVGISRAAYDACLQALDRYEAQTMWNVQPPANRQGALDIIRHLQEKGDMDAYELSLKIRNLLENAD